MTTEQILLTILFSFITVGVGLLFKKLYGMFIDWFFKWCKDSFPL